MLLASSGLISTHIPLSFRVNVQVCLVYMLFSPKYSISLISPSKINHGQDKNIIDKEIN